MTLPGLESWQPQKKKPDSRLINVDSGFLWCFKMVGQVAGMFYFLRVKTRQPLDHSEMRGIWETVNRSIWESQKIRAEGYILICFFRLNHCKARAAENWGKEHQWLCLCRAGKNTGPGAQAFSHLGSTDFLPAWGSSQGWVLSLSWVWTPGLLGQIPCSIFRAYACPRSHLLRGIYQKHLASSFLSEENTAQALCKATTLAGFWNSEIFALMKK